MKHVVLAFLPTAALLVLSGHRWFHQPASNPPEHVAAAATSSGSTQHMHPSYDSAEPDDRATGVTTAARWFGGTPIPLPTRVEIDGRTLSVDEHVLGVTEDGWLTFVVLTGAFGNGARFEYASPLERIRVVARDCSDLRGSRFRDPGGQVHTIAEVGLALDQRGYLYAAYLELEAGEHVGGRRESRYFAVGAGCCKLRLVPSSCMQFGQCDPPCTELPCNCSGDGSCLIISEFKCRGLCGPPGCPPGTCKAPGSPLNCGCQ